jgi:hypothetical protein
VRSQLNARSFGGITHDRGIKSLVTLTFLMAILAFSPCGQKRPTGYELGRAKSVGATWLLDSVRFAASREARDSVEADLRLHGREPCDYFAAVERRGDTLIVFHLWHRAGLRREATGVDGDPSGGRSYDAYFDRRRHRMTRRFVWS